MEGVCLGLLTLGTESKWRDLRRIKERKVGWQRPRARFNEVGVPAGASAMNPTSTMGLFPPCAPPPNQLRSGVWIIPRRTHRGRRGEIVPFASWNACTNGTTGRAWRWIPPLQGAQGAVWRKVQKEEWEMGAKETDKKEITGRCGTQQQQLLCLTLYTYLLVRQPWKLCQAFLRA